MTVLRAFRVRLTGAERESSKAAAVAMPHLAARGTAHRDANTQLAWRARTISAIVPPRATKLLAIRHRDTNAARTRSHLCAASVVARRAPCPRAGAAGRLLRCHRRGRRARRRHTLFRPPHFRRHEDRGLRGAALPAHGACRRRTCDGAAHAGADGVWAESVRLLSPAARGRAFHALGAEHR